MKTAWIFPGGSARAVYTAGALYALCNMNIKEPDMIIAASGSAPTSICYVTGQHEIILKVWLESLSTRKFVSLWRFWKILDIDYLVDDVLKGKNPLDMERMTRSDIVVYFPLTNSRTGKIEYFSNRAGVNMWEILRASISVPIFTNLFSVRGSLVGDKFFSDSSPASRFQLHVKKAISEGATRIVVFDNWHNDDNPTTYFISKAFACLHGPEFRRNQLSYINEVENFSIPNNVEFIKIEPKLKLGMSRLEIDNANARRIFKRGYDDTLNNDKLKEIPA
ncbi:MAG: hypothetical protein HYT62_00665 [Candidatus Yanofskybacteria bacterium]|nr:hypothetical protein [Candidatus Yanofskybacteria bacterium]